MTTPTPVGTPTDAQIRQLAAQINKPQLTFDPGYMRKGTIAAIDKGNSTTPPTVTVYLSGDTTVPIAGVYLAANYSPQVGDTCLLFKQGNEFFAQGTIATSPTGTGWTTASLSSGNTHNGNSNGSLMYRRVMDNGAWKMQWQGGINYGGSANILASALGSDFRPSVKRSMISAREVQSGSIVIGIDFKTDGTVTIVGENQGAPSAGSHSHFADLGGGGSGSGSGFGHSHSYSGGTTGGSSEGSSVSVDVEVSGSTNSGGSHTHTVSSPSWIAFNGIEYFL